MDAKIDTGACFCSMLFWNAFLHRFFVRIFEAPNLKNRALASTGARFLQNQRFLKRYEKSMILASFLEAKAKKIRFKIDSKMCCFKASHFKRFFFDFASILDAPNLCKITKFLKKSKFGGSF